MKSLVTDEAERFLREQKRKRRRMTAFLCLAVIVAFGTVMALKYRGIAVNHTKQVLNCKYVVHNHTEDCYIQTESGRLLACGYADYVVHTHNDDCRDADGNLVCQLSEVEEHQHDDSCYQKEQVLSCGMEASDGHQHEESCYAKEQGVLLCQQEEHQHGDECYDEENVLICTMEEHEHSDSCYASEEVLVCGLEAGAGGHIHNENCYSESWNLICGKLELHTHIPQNEPGSCYDEQGNLTCGLFQLEEHVHGAECLETVELTGEEVAALNDDEAESSDTEAENDVSETEREIFTMEDDAEEIVSGERRQQTVETMNYIVTVDYTDAKNLPDQVELKVTEYEKGSEEYEAYRKEAGGEFDWLMDVSFFVDGKEMEPDGNVDVKVTAKANVETISSDIVHFTENGMENLEGVVTMSADGEVTVEFSSDSFSVLGSRSAEAPKYDGGETPKSIGESYQLQDNDIKKISVSRLTDDGKWEEVNLADYVYTVGDKIRLNLHYDLPEGTLTDTNTVLYQLPEGITILEAIDAPLLDNNNQIIGRIYLDTSGQVTLIYSDQFRTEPKDIGDSQFTIDAEVSSGNSGNGGNIVFPGGGGGTIHVQNESDLSLNKSGTYNTETKEIDYVVTVSTQKGSDGKVDIHDTFAENTNTPKAEIKSFTIKKVSADGTVEMVPAGQYQLEGGVNSQTFDITGLPELDEGEKYIVEYSVDPGEIDYDSDDKTAELVNSVTAGNGKHHPNVKIKTNLSKPKADKEDSYWYDNDEIVWTIKVDNPTGEDLAGKEIKELLPEGLSYVKGSLTVNWNMPGGGWPLDFEGEEGNLTYTFPADSTATSYTIQFRTKVTVDGEPEEKKEFVNKIEFEGEPDEGKGHYEYPSDKVSEGSIQKGHGNPAASGTKGLELMTWNVTVKAPGGDVTSVTVRDTITDAVNEADYQSEPNTHYTTTEEIEKLAKQIEEKGYRVTYKLYSDEEGTATSADGEKVKSFELEITKEGDTPFNEDEEISFSYQTYMDLSAVDKGGSWKFLNTAYMGNHQSSSDYTKKPKIEKLSGGETGNYGDNLSVDYENGILRYAVILRLDGSDLEDGKIELTDTMSEGMEIDPESVDVFYWAWGQDSSNNRFNTDFNGTIQEKDGEFVYVYPSWDATYRPDDHTTVTQTENVATITISDYPAEYTTCPLVIIYKVRITDEDFKNAVGKISIFKNNTIEWEGKGKDGSGITVNKESEDTKKRGHVDEDDNNLIDYTVDINPSGADLDETSDTITLTDNFKVYTVDTNGKPTTNEAGDVYAYLQLGEVRLYEYKTYYQFNEDGSLKTDEETGEPIKSSNPFEISSARYSISYDQKKNEMKVTVPDELACVLEYQYLLKPGAYDKLAVQNQVSLLGKTGDSTGITWTTEGLSGRVDSMNITVVKTDSADNSIRLEGVKFTLWRYDKDTKSWMEAKEVNEENEEKDLITDSNGELILTESMKYRDENEKVHYYTDTLFCLKEVETPANYKPQEFYFVCGKKGAANTVDIPDDVNRNDIIELSEYGGDLYAFNDYTAITATKIWADAAGHRIEAPPEGQEVELELWEGAIDGYTVKLKFNNDKVTEYLVAPGTDFSFKLYNGSDGSVSVQPENGGNAESFENGEGDKADYLPGQEWCFAHPYSIKVTGDCTISNNQWDHAISEPVYTKPVGVKDGKPVEFPEGSQETARKVLTLDKDGKWTCTWQNLSKDKIYFVKEINVPDGWQVSYMNNSGISSGNITVINKKKESDYSIPETGGAGTIIYTFGGAALMALSLMYGLGMKRKKERRVRS